MSTTEIINELPRLTETERRAVRQKLLELAVQDEDVRLCNQAALEGAQVLDRMEEEDARRQQGHIPTGSHSNDTMRSWVHKSLATNDTNSANEIHLGLQ